MNAIDAFAVGPSWKDKRIETMEKQTARPTLQMMRKKRLPNRSTPKIGRQEPTKYVSDAPPPTIKEALKTVELSPGALKEKFRA